MSRRTAPLLAAAFLTVAALPVSTLAAEPLTDEIVDPFGATPVTVDADVIDPMPQAWDQVLIGSDGRTLDVYFWGGVEECYGLHSVTVEPTHSGIDLQLAMGLQPEAADQACIEIAVLYVTTVTLDEPLISQPMG